ncbi:hypothetical protein D3C72_2548550 [compost metagenome]
MFQCLKHDVVGLVEHIGDQRIAVQPHPQRKDVDEEANQRIQQRIVPPRYRGAGAHIRVSGLTMNQ